ncbi:MAG: hypothetical protein Q9P01_21415 [Anaerolineae bacterium]|nr:hypothetical protein [Anaerolineae bacterium]MDQ7037303.1 hypothetical protein [Anaerolineae bacterium]
MRPYWLIYILLLIAPVMAQDDNRQYRIHDEVTVTITAASPAILVFANDTAGQVITLTARAIDNAQVDPVLWIIDSDSQLLAYNHNTLSDDGLIDVSARISNLVLPTIGLYTVYIDSFNGVGAGEVEVTFRASDRFDMAVEDSDSAQIIRFTLPEDTIFAYPITVDVGDSLIITASDGSGRLDPYLRIVASDGTIVASNDDHHSPDLSLNIFDARINGWTVLADDTYTVEVFDFLGRAGNMLLEIQKHD